MGGCTEDVAKFVLNVGSSSIKYAAYSCVSSAPGQPALSVILQGLAEGIGTPEFSRIRHTCTEGGSQKLEIPLPDHHAAFRAVLDLLPSNLRDSIACVGHRIVHGGEAFSSAVVVNEDVLKSIEEAVALAPLHNPWGLLGIQTAMELFGPHCPQVAVFDTAFHQTIEPSAFLYAVPYELYTKHHIRKYGFHGTSYRYVSDRTASVLGKPLAKLNCIICHIGNGASMCAVRNGKSVDTTMGLSPLEGLIMGSRSGDLDPTVPMHLVSQLGYSQEEVSSMLNKRSGLLGICGTNDDREIEQRVLDKEPMAVLAKNMQIHRMRKYLGAYMVALEGDVDALVFTGGMGEKSHLLRTLVCENLDRMGLRVDEDRNKANFGRFSEETPIHDQGAGGIQIWVIPTDEELCIAEQMCTIIRKS